MSYKAIKERWDKYSAEVDQEKEAQSQIQEFLEKIFTTKIGDTNITDPKEYDRYIARVRRRSPVASQEKILKNE